MTLTVACATLVQVAKFHVGVIFSSEVTINFNKYHDIVHCFKGVVNNYMIYTLKTPKSRLTNIEIKESVNTNQKF